MEQLSIDLLLAWLFLFDFGGNEEILERNELFVGWKYSFQASFRIILVKWNGEIKDVRLIHEYAKRRIKRPMAFTVSILACFIFKAFYTRAIRVNVPSNDGTAVNQSILGRGVSIAWIRWQV